MATVNDWIKEAEKQAKKYSDGIKNSNQYLIDQLVTNKQNSLSQLEQQNKNDIYNLNANKATIDRTASENAKQLNIARLMALKDNQETLNRAGLGTQGIVGSQVNSINNSYGTDLTNILNQKSDSMRELEKQKQALLLNYNTNKTNIENEYGTNLANLQQEINNRALSQYNTIYSNYLAQRQQAYENEQAELARQEAIRQYNTNLAYQKEQDKIANAQKLYTLKNQSNNLEFDDTPASTKSNSILGTFGKLLTNAINNAKETAKNSVYKITENYTPNFSTPLARYWAQKNIYNSNITKNGISEYELRKILQQGLNGKAISQNDADNILRTFGL